MATPGIDTKGDSTIPFVNASSSSKNDKNEDNNGDGNKKKCCSLFHGNRDATGYAWLGAGRGAMTMANIFLNSALLSLAVEAAGCELGEECLTRVHGFYPSSWVANIASLASLVAGFFMPVIGAMVDFTDYRRGFGILSAVIMIVIQGVQIFTVLDTWFAMLLLQAVCVAFYFFHMVSIYAYLPELAREVGEHTMATFTSHFQIAQFGTQVLYLVLIGIIAFGFDLTAVPAGRISQLINTVTSIVLFGIGWFVYMGSRKAVRKLPEGHSLLLEGFRNNFKTIQSIQKHFKKGIRWFFLAVCFSQAAAQSVTSLSVIYLTDTLQLSTVEISMFFFDVLGISLVGCPIGAKIAQRFNPKISYAVSILYIFITLVVGLLFMEYGPTYGVYIWGAVLGVGLGWFYAVEPLYLSMLLPHGQEAEMAGFYNFCSVIIAWLPPVLFTIAVENNVQQRHAVVAASTFFIPALIFLMCSGKWEDILEETKTGMVQDAVVAATLDKKKNNNNNGDEEKAKSGDDEEVAA